MGEDNQPEKLKEMQTFIHSLKSCLNYLCFCFLVTKIGLKLSHAITLLHLGMSFLYLIDAPNRARLLVGISSS